MFGVNLNFWVIGSYLNNIFIFLDVIKFYLFILRKSRITIKKSKWSYFIMFYANNSKDTWIFLHSSGNCIITFNIKLLIPTYFSKSIDVMKRRRNISGFFFNFHKWCYWNCFLLFSDIKFIMFTLPGSSGSDGTQTQESNIGQAILCSFFFFNKIFI